MIERVFCVLPFGPNVHVACAVPLAPVFTTEGVTEPAPPVTVKRTETPETGFWSWS